MTEEHFCDESHPRAKKDNFPKAEYLVIPEDERYRDRRWCTRHIGAGIAHFVTKVGPVRVEKL